MRRLKLGLNDGLQLAPHSFSGLGVLEELDLFDCGLAADHATLSGVQYMISLY